MLKQIKHDVLNHKIQRSTIAKCARRIEVVSTKFSPFFGIVDVFVQTNPEYAGIFWGAIRLVFLWGSNFTSFLEKTCEMFEFMVALYPHTKTQPKRKPSFFRIGSALEFWTLSLWFILIFLSSVRKCVESSHLTQTFPERQRRFGSCLGLLFIFNLEASSRALRSMHKSLNLR